MKMKKVLALAMAAMMTFSMAACGDKKAVNNNNDVQGSGEEEITLTVWTLADDLKQFAERYTELHPNVKINVEVTAPADYPTMLTTALGAKSSDVDIIVGEPQMLPNFFEAGFFEDLSAYGAEDFKGTIADYVFDIGTDDNGVVRALSYQVTPGSFIYRRDLAKEVWGTDDPEEISKKFATFDSIISSARDVKEKGYRLFGDSGNLRWFANKDGAWVVDGKLNVTQARYDYMDAAVTLYQDELVAFSPEWSAAWYASMGGEIPLNAEWSDLADVAGNDTTQVLAYVLPSWGALIVRDNAEEIKGNFGLASGPCSFFGGGTFLGINAYSKNKEAAWDFIKFCTADEETAQWWLEKSEGDVVSNIAVLEANTDYTNPSFGGQNTYTFYAEEAKAIDVSLITGYDDTIGNYWGTAIEKIQKGEMTREQAIEDFYLQVESTYPDLIIEK